MPKKPFSKAIRGLGGVPKKLPVRKSKRTGSKPTAPPIHKSPANAPPRSGGQEAILRGTAGLRAVERRLQSERKR